MEEYFRISQESTKATVNIADPQHATIKTIIKLIEKYPSYAEIILFCSLMFFLSNESMAQENIKTIENIYSTTEIITKNWNTSFAYPPFTGPIGCKEERSEKVCRKDEKPITSYSYEVIFSKGWGTSITDIKQDGDCIIVFYRLSVDNSGPEGRTCLSIYSNLQVKFKLNN
ncbi:hypothetical protein ABLV58_11450 [Klebsiella sp. JB_Kp046]|uniref:hypothetical protein n=1 Tax=Klebsiella TaxID=570 RepID=UPI0015A59B2F|nr:hypothetical protein [Klebsiella variicola]HDT2220779.1 hypothetical protein [Klebsiella variicola]HEE0884646.1 hypothetical protein [Klebsiella pneumoniae]